MKIMVAAKRVVDPNAPLRIAAGGMELESRNLPHSINPFDEAAIARAALLRRNGEAEQVLAVSIGGEKCADTLRTALGMGADRAVHVAWEDETPPSSLAVARIFHRLAQEERPDMIMMGKQASDSDNGAAAAMLAALLGWPLLPGAHELEREGEGFRIAFEQDGLACLANVAPPLVMSADLHLCQPAPLGLAQIMKSRQKPIETVNALELAGMAAGGGDMDAADEWEQALAAGRYERLGLREREPRSNCLMAANIEELASNLRKEGVLP
jgi:electron transfer flavoprotein beta subunit